MTRILFVVVEISFIFKFKSKYLYYIEVFGTFGATNALMLTPAHQTIQLTTWYVSVTKWSCSRWRYKFLLPPEVDQSLGNFTMCWGVRSLIWYVVITVSSCTKSKPISRSETTQSMPFSLCVSVCLSVCRSVCLSVCRSVCLSVC